MVKASRNVVQSQRAGECESQLNVERAAWKRPSEPLASYARMRPEFAESGGMSAAFLLLCAFQFTYELEERTTVDASFCATFVMVCRVTANER